LYSERTKNRSIGVRKESAKEKLGTQRVIAVGSNGKRKIRVPHRAIR